MAYLKKTYENRNYFDVQLILQKGREDKYIIVKILNDYAPISVKITNISTEPRLKNSNIWSFEYFDIDQKKAIIMDLLVKEHGFGKPFIMRGTLIDDEYNGIKYKRLIVFEPHYNLDLTINAVFDTQKKSFAAYKYHKGLENEE